MSSLAMAVFPAELATCVVMRLCRTGMFTHSSQSDGAHGWPNISDALQFKLHQSESASARVQMHLPA